ncbi:hypothetical protein [Pseudomonas phage SDFMU_Ppc]|uniref:Uncharacterized protein n=1 Tax=Pseudomonas phage SDFMU_Ppc TaxID=3076137 RepID=A0AA96KQS3_9CAUD|nr:hypothetical protein [Pseudomonas phage SDFMU_Ppc]
MEPQRGIADRYAPTPWPFLLTYFEPQADFHPCQDSAEGFEPAPASQDVDIQPPIDFVSATVDDED